MKKIVLILLLFVVSINFFNAQTATKGMKYQAVARDMSGLELSNKPISLQIVLVGDIKSSTIYYSEFHNVITNEFGLFSLNIGSIRSLCQIDFYGRYELYSDLIKPHPVFIDDLSC